MAEQHRLDAGATLFSEGDAADIVIHLLSGEVEVSKRSGDADIVLGRIGPGEFVGEMGVLERRPRAATVRAVTPIIYELLDAEQFLDRVSGNRELALRTLRRLSERLHRADEQIARLAAPRTDHPVETSDGVSARLGAGTPAVQSQIGEAYIEIRSFPFTVGRRPASGESAPPYPISLVVDDTRPYRLSRHHFSILRTPEGLAVTDEGSALGTVVDDTPLGEDLPNTRVKLDPGEHRIVAGGIDSPYGFKLIIP